MFKLKVEHEDVLYLEYSGNREGVNNRYRSYSSQGTCSTLQVQLLVKYGLLCTITCQLLSDTSYSRLRLCAAVHAGRKMFGRWEGPVVGTSGWK